MGVELQFYIIKWFAENVLNGEWFNSCQRLKSNKVTSKIGGNSQSCD